MPKTTQIDVLGLRKTRQDEITATIKNEGWQSVAEIEATNPKIKSTAIRRELTAAVAAGLLETEVFKVGVGKLSKRYYRNK
jgi:predicted ArsR family transcriptional regulator